MRVIYDKTPFACVHRIGVKLVPGEFEIENEEAAKILIELGIVTSVSPPAPTVDEPEPETNDDAVSDEETREVEETDFDEEQEEEA